MPDPAAHQLDGDLIRAGQAGVAADQLDVLVLSQGSWPSSFQFDTM